MGDDRIIFLFGEQLVTTGDVKYFKNRVDRLVALIDLFNRSDHNIASDVPAMNLADHLPDELSGHRLRCCKYDYFNMLFEVVQDFLNHFISSKNS